MNPTADALLGKKLHDGLAVLHANGVNVEDVLAILARDRCDHAFDRTKCPFIVAGVRAAEIVPFSRCFSLMPRTAPWMPSIRQFQPTMV
jgi:hypothetical protein